VGDEDEMALFIKKFNKYISKRRPFKGDATIVVKNGHFIARCPYERKMKRKRRRARAIRKTRNSQRRSLMDNLMLVKNETQVMRVLSRKVMTWQP
jgi:hypothetical protein